MEPELTFRSDLYRGTAPYYDRFRRPYPEALLEDLCRRVPVSAAGRLLDLACGTGQIAFPVADRFAEVCAVDKEPLNREVLGDKVGEFEQDLAQRLCPYQPDGVFSAQTGFAYQLARKPGAT
jgi:SAM-dependent methyltransferase